MGLSFNDFSNSSLVKELGFNIEKGGNKVYRCLPPLGTEIDGVCTTEEFPILSWDSSTFKFKAESEYNRKGNTGNDLFVGADFKFYSGTYFEEGSKTATIGWTLYADNSTELEEPEYIRLTKTLRKSDVSMHHTVSDGEDKTETFISNIIEEAIQSLTIRQFLLGAKTEIGEVHIGDTLILDFKIDTSLDKAVLIRRFVLRSTELKGANKDSNIAYLNSQKLPLNSHKRSMNVEGKELTSFYNKAVTDTEALLSSESLSYLNVRAKILLNKLRQSTLEANGYHYTNMVLTEAVYSIPSIKCCNVPLVPFVRRTRLGVQVNIPIAVKLTPKLNICKEGLCMTVPIAVGIFTLINNYDGTKEAKLMYSMTTYGITHEHTYKFDN